MPLYSITRYFLRCVFCACPKSDNEVVRTTGRNNTPKDKRSHWGIENALHWTLDVAYNEEHCRARADNAAIVFNLMRHLSLNLLSQEKSSKGGIKSKRLRCALSFQYLEKVLHISYAFALVVKEKPC
jgi:hypothetical protein